MRFLVYLCRSKIQHRSKQPWIPRAVQPLIHHGNNWILQPKNRCFKSTYMHGVAFPHLPSNSPNCLKVFWIFGSAAKNRSPKKSKKKIALSATMSDWGTPFPFTNPKGITPFHLSLHDITSSPVFIWRTHAPGWNSTPPNGYPKPETNNIAPKNPWSLNIHFIFGSLPCFQVQKNCCSLSGRVDCKTLRFGKKSTPTHQSKTSPTNGPFLNGPFGKPEYPNSSS